MDIYMDAEFDCVRKNGRFVQCLISVGMIAIENDCVFDSFYSLIQPKNFRCLTNSVKRITKLSDEEIRKAPSFREVMKKANAFLERCHKPYQLYTFGPDDIRTLKQQAVYEGYGKIQAFRNFINLQKEISRSMIYEDKIISNNLSLDDLKFIFGMNHKVVHNALNDALDLYLIHDAYQRAAIQPERLQIIGERKKQKKADAKKRSLNHIQNLLFERYHFYEHQKGSCPLYLDVCHLIEELKERGCVKLPAEAVSVLSAKSFEQGSIAMEWLMHPYPLVKLTLCLPEGTWEQECTLTFGNANAFEQIWKLCKK